MDRLVIDDIDLKDRRVLVRVDFNVPIENGSVVEDTRIQAAIPTLKKVTDDGGKLILMSHLGRPQGKPEPELSLQPVARRLAEILAKEVKMAENCVGESAESAANALRPGDVLLLENTRFHPEETANDAEFAQKLASLGDVFVNDAFGAVHRAHASTVGVAKIVKEAVAGYLIMTEVENLNKLLEAPDKPFVAILGGAKVSDKLKVIHNLVTKVNTILIGGAMAYTFLKAKGIEIGASLLDDERLSMAYNAMVVASNPHPYKRLDFMLPIDHVVSKSAGDAEYQTTEGEAISEESKAVDIGPQTAARFTEVVKKARTIFWNGPMGIFEVDQSAKGTMEIARAVAAATEAGAFSVVGGGDSIAAIEKAGVKDKISHVSTGGGASLEYLAGIDLPGIMALTKAKRKPVKKAVKAE